MRTRLLSLVLPALCCAALPAHVTARVPAGGGPVYVVLWFDTEDYILPQSDDAALRIAEMLTRLGVKATFKVVGEKARVLETRGRTDVIAALKRHEIGFHSNTHSQQPTVAVYLQHSGWQDGIAEFERRESPGVRDIERIFGVTPTAYGQPGSAWAPQAYPALRHMGVRMYLDEADHVGLDDQPFYYGGMLNVFRMRSTLARMELTGGSSLANGQAAFTKIAGRLRARGGGTISVYYHPCEFIHAEFWDGVNFAHGANPPRSAWKAPAIRAPESIETAFADFERYVEFIKKQPDVRFVTASDLLELYADRARTRSFGSPDLLSIARRLRDEISFQRLDDAAVSAADAFALLTDAMVAYIDRGELPPATPLRVLDGPGRPFTAAAGATRSTAFAWPAFQQAIRDAAAFSRASGRVPDEIWIGSENISPADYLATMAGVFEDLAAGRPPAEVSRRAGRFTADRYVSEDSPALWSWVIFPDGFHAPQIVELAKLQAWTLKPAVLAPPRASAHHAP